MSCKVLLLLCFIHFGTAQFALTGGWFHVGSASIGAKGNSNDEIMYTGPSSFVGAVKLVHTKGYLSNRRVHDTNSHWGSSTSNGLSTIITDVENRILYPSPRVTQVSDTGWYAMPGYNNTSPNLIFSDFCAPQYFEEGRKLRIWYGEDLYGFTEMDNHGTCHMEVYFYVFGDMIMGKL